MTFSLGNSAFVILGALMLSAPQPIHASAQISEVYPAPLSGESEWIELHNPGLNTVEMNGWWLEDVLASPSVLHTFSELLLAPGSFTVIELTQNKLNNDKDGVVLKNSSGDTVHSIFYQGSSPGQSWSVSAGDVLYASPPTPGSDNAPPPTTPPSPSPTPSPSANPTPQPTSSPVPSTGVATSSDLTQAEFIARKAREQLILTEIAPCPESRQPEWFEVFHTGDTAISLHGWWVIDALGNTRPIAGVANPNTYSLFSWSSPILNNTGDALSVHAADGSLVFRAEHAACTQGKSLHSINGVWHIGSQTPGFGPPETEISYESGLLEAQSGLFSKTGEQITFEPLSSTSGLTDTALDTTTLEQLSALNHKQLTAINSTLSREAGDPSSEKKEPSDETTHEMAPIQPIYFAPRAQSTAPARTLPTHFAENGILSSVIVMLSGLTLIYVSSRSHPQDLVARVSASAALGRADLLF
jgi:hypothetical protein